MNHTEALIELVALLRATINESKERQDKFERDALVETAKRETCEQILLNLQELTGADW